MLKQQPSYKALAKTQEHLQYEVRMLFETMIALQNLPRTDSPTPEQWCTNNALIESFLIHARALIDFLYTHPSPKKRDVLAKHFLEDPAKWKKEHYNLPPLLHEARERAHKEVAHLSYMRASIGLDDKKWPVGEIAERILSDLGEWMKLASPGKVSDSLAQTISRSFDAVSKTQAVYTVDSTTAHPEVHIYGSNGRT